MEQLNKNQFDQMPLNDQIKYINNELRKEGSSLTGICKEIGIARSTVRERSKKQGFIFDKKLNQYVKNVNKPVLSKPLRQPLQKIRIRRLRRI